ncbi:MAG: polysaccharide biosynthesis tyrosine autokinase [Bacteroidota bacterium]
MHSNQEPREEFFGERSPFNVKKMAVKFASNWHWFIVSLTVCAIIAFLYTRYTSPMYSTGSKILITEDKMPSPGDEALPGMLGSRFGLINSAEGEAEVLRTRVLMAKVVRDLKGYITYYHKGNVRLSEMYQTAPFKLTVLSSPDSIFEQKMEVRLNGNRVSITGEVEYTGEEYSRSVNLYQQFTIPGLGKVLVERGVGIANPEQEYIVEIGTLRETIDDFMEQLEVKIPIVMVKILSLEFISAVPEKSEDVLNGLTKAYIESALSDKNRIADSTIAFIENRLLYVSRELGSIEGNVQSFKQRNQLTDISAQATQLISSTKESVDDLGKTETQLSVLNSLEQYLTAANAAERIVPSGALLDDPGFGSLIERYNTIVLEKERSSLSQTEQNPYIQNLNTQIESARSDMLSSLRGLKRSLEITKKRALSQSNVIAGQVRKVPAVERTYLDLSRQQQIKQELYVFLLQKREEIAISKTSNISNCRVIEPPVSMGPISPRKSNAYGYGIILGLLFPMVAMMAKDKFNTRIISRAQITGFTRIPIIGEIGHSTEHNETIVINQNSRTPIAEQFRSLRTNLSFFLKGNEKTILLTSSMSGEGKSFISLNLATALAFSGKRVVMMEMDLRRPNLSNKLNLKNDFGFTNFVVDKDISPDRIVKPSGTHENLFVVSSGNLPPNPAEVIINNRTDLLISYLVDNFDYIILDAPPVGMVTDAQLLSKFSDLTLYVIRQRYTHKEQLVIPQDIYINKKMNNIALLVNDVKSSSSYGYGYGFGYGYDYGAKVEKRGFFDKLFKKK